MTQRAQLRRTGFIPVCGRPFATVGGRQCGERSRQVGSGGTTTAERVCVRLAQLPPYARSGTVGAARVPGGGRASLGRAGLAAIHAGVDWGSRRRGSGCHRSRGGLGHIHRVGVRSVRTAQSLGLSAMLAALRRTARDVAMAQQPDASESGLAVRVSMRELRPPTVAQRGPRAVAGRLRRAACVNGAAQRGMKLTTPGQRRSFAAYARCRAELKRVRRRVRCAAVRRRRTGAQIQGRPELV